MKKYFTDNIYPSRIAEIECLEETEKCIFLPDGGELKKSCYGSYWDTWDEAKQYLMRACLEKIDNLRNRLSKKEELLAKIIRLTDDCS